MEFEKIHNLRPGTLPEIGGPRTDIKPPPDIPKRKKQFVDESGVPYPEHQLRGFDYVRPARGFDGEPVDLG